MTCFSDMTWGSRNPTCILISIKAAQLSAYTCDRLLVFADKVMLHVRRADHQEPASNVPATPCVDTRRFTWVANRVSDSSPTCNVLLPGVHMLSLPIQEHYVVDSKDCIGCMSSLCAGRWRCMLRIAQCRTQEGPTGN